jgi:subtilisin family serine protease
MLQSARRLTLLGTAFAVLSLGLPWRSIAATPGYLTSGYYSNYCDYSGYCYTTFTPGVLVPGLPGGSYPGTDSVVRFFIATAVALALIGGLHLGRRGALRWASYAGVAGVALYLLYGLMGGMLTLLLASACFWLASRDVIRTEQAGAPPV